MARVRQVLLCALAAAGACAAQSMVEYAASAAVGTAGSAGGKAVSNSLDRVFAKTGKLIEKTAAGPKETPGVEKSSRERAKSTPAAGSAPRSSRAAGARVDRYRSVRPAAKDTERAVAGASAWQAAPPAAPPRRAASAEEFRAIAPGISRQDLVNRVGEPSYRVRISGDGHVQEICRYTSGGVDLGRVGVVDGAVTAVKIRNQ